MTRWLGRAALWLVPHDWRDAVCRDLGEEIGARRALAFALEAARVGLSLRTSRLSDRIARRSTRPAIPSRRILMRDFTRDVFLAVRGMRRHPAYSLAVIATLAIGIGANTAIFSVFNWILFRPMPGVVEPHELVTVRYQNPKLKNVHFWVSHRDYADLRDGVPALAVLAASQDLDMDAATGKDAERLTAEVVTPNYLSLFGVTPVLGRDFMSTEEQPGAHAPAAVISHRLWRRAYDGALNVLGKTISLDGRPFAIVGVAPSAFQGRSLATVTDVWIPIGAYPTLQPRFVTGLLTNRSQTVFGDSFGRLRPGATLAQAQEQASAVAANVPFAGRTRDSGRPSIGPVLTRGIGYGALTEERLATIFRLLMGAVGLLLLLACANAGNLLLARTTGRRREIAVCQAIGASRFRIIRQQLAEAFVLSIAAGAAGLTLAVGLTWLFEGMTVIPSLPPLQGIGIDWRVCLFALVASISTAIVFAIAPAIVSSRVDLQTNLKDGAMASRGGRRMLRGGLVTAQISLSVMLFIAAGLFMRTLHNLRSLDLGLDVGRVISLSVEPSRYGYNARRSQAYVRELLERLRQAPGIDSAAFSWTTPYSPNRNDTAFLRPDGRKVSAASTTVSSGFFQTMGIPVIAGRDFSDTDLDADNNTHGVAVISRRLAQELFPEGGAVGATVPISYPEGKRVEIIGIVGDVRGRPLTDAPEPWAYLPAGTMSWGTIQLRSALPASQAIATIRSIARSIDPVVMPYDIEPFGASIDRVISEPRLFARLSGLFAAIGALLAGIGIYGMMSGAVAERRKEFGIRLALGARGAAVLALVIRTSLILAATGLVTGLAAAAGLRRFVEARLYGVTPLDPLTIAVTATAVLALSLAAALLPGLRAARVDPVRSLRVD